MYIYLARVDSSFHPAPNTGKVLHEGGKKKLISVESDLQQPFSKNQINANNINILTRFIYGANKPPTNSHAHQLWILGHHNPESVLLSVANAEHRQLEGISTSDSEQAIKISLNLTKQQAANLRQQLTTHCHKLDTILTKTPNAPIQLACFDMDSTLIETEVIDELAKLAGKGKDVQAITESAMRGELDFKQSLTKRLAFIKGLDKAALATVAETLPLSPGVERLFAGLHELGVSTAIVSGGFQLFANTLQKKLNVNQIFANQLEIKNDKLTGRYQGDLVDSDYKRRKLIELQGQLEKNQTINSLAVGDGANDIAMLKQADLGIAYRAKPLVQTEVGNALNNAPLDSLLPIVKDSFNKSY